MQDLCINHLNLGRSIMYVPVLALTLPLLKVETRFSKRFGVSGLGFRV